MHPSETDPDYVLQLLEQPELIPGELRRVEEQRAGRHRRLMLAGVACLVLVGVSFWSEETRFFVIPLVALAFNLGEWRGETRRLDQLHATLKELREARPRPVAAG